MLSGHRLRGAFALTRTRMGGNERNWILVKVDDEYADPARVGDERPRLSVLTDRRLEVDATGG